MLNPSTRPGVQMIQTWSCTRSPRVPVIPYDLSCPPGRSLPGLFSALATPPQSSESQTSSPVRSRYRYGTALWWERSFWERPSMPVRALPMDVLAQRFEIPVGPRDLVPAPAMAVEVPAQAGLGPAAVLPLPSMGPASSRRPLLPALPLLSCVPVRSGLVHRKSTIILFHLCVRGGDRHDRAATGSGRWLEKGTVGHVPQRRISLSVPSLRKGPCERRDFLS
ncbi:unnamed protein product [Calypogeia fissa]